MEHCQDRAADPVVEANRQMLKDRSDVGVRKYGVMLNRTDLDHRAWLQHALEEALDMANYLQAAIQQIDREPKPLPIPTDCGKPGCPICFGAARART